MDREEGRDRIAGGVRDKPGPPGRRQAARGPAACRGRSAARGMAEASGGMTMWTPRQIVEHYERGDLTRTDLFISLMQAVTESNAAEFVTSATPDLLEEVEKYVESCPH